MKRFSQACALLLCFFATAGGAFAENSRNFHIAAQLGFGYASNPDMNDSVSVPGNYIANSVNAFAASHSAQGGFQSHNEKADWNFGFDIEPRFFLSESFGFSLSAGYHAAEASSEITSEHWRDNAKFRTKLSVIPILGTLYYRSILSDSSFFLLGAGIGYYRATLERQYVDNITISSLYGEDVSFEYESSAIGYHARLEFDYTFTMVALYAGVMGRYVHFDKFELEGIALQNAEDSNFTANLTGAFMYFGAALMI